MVKGMILRSLIKNRTENKKSLSLLIDPDKIESGASLDIIIKRANTNCIDYFLIGGSLLISRMLGEVVNQIKQSSKIPVILFPGSNMHIHESADAILFLSLISGRNPDLLIGQHVAAAPVLRETNLEILSTGYILVGDPTTTVAYISQTLPIPYSKSEIAVCTALAGEMLGMQLIYLDAGSGANAQVSISMVQQVRNAVSVPLIVGGGLDNTQKVENAFASGADLIVLGTAVEKNIKFLDEAIRIRNKFNDLNIHE
jgi:putative glycerol-1-phosphate prenyltransferase